MPPLFLQAIASGRVLPCLWEVSFSSMYTNPREKLGLDESHMARIAMKDILHGSHDHHFRSSAKHLGLSPSGVPQAKRSLGKGAHVLVPRVPPMTGQ
ncbi:hypothetical protein BDV36DRAFT_4976 [Aspergillus pseudocaelatus]|uniref:Uncharacterized protein n=1 Tax=Aspergillus pseudocaelatus TaxID=1825620 RepID=A0ABQ6WY81_9EURO|nr:hypothetical protein BDV36DRAFT_4976 [Aspergillus pseudocaelatus]